MSITQNIYQRNSLILIASSLYQLRVVKHEASELTLIRQVGNFSVTSADIEFVSPFGIYSEPSRKMKVGMFFVVDDHLILSYISCCYNALSAFRC